MNKFFNKLTITLTLPLVLLVISNVIGLYLLNREYKFSLPNGLKYIKQSEQGHILMIGCSNLMHNIDKHQLKQKYPQVDYLYFAGNQNSSFVKYLSESKQFSHYDTIILYLPYSTLKKNVAVSSSDEISKSTFISYDYALSTIRNTKVNFFNNWLWNYLNVKLYRSHPSNNYPIFTLKDNLLDSLCGVPSYLNCENKFDASKHQIEHVDYTTDDVSFICGLFPGKTMYILLTPMPNTANNVSTARHINKTVKLFPNLLNSAYTMDSSLFYDQWYHLNHCGNQLETAHLIRVLDSLRSNSNSIVK